MGIVVDGGRRVSYCAQTHDLIDSRVDQNPVVQSVGDFEVFAVFRRVKSRKNKSDGNPLMYALKAKDGYTIDLSDIVAFGPEFYGVLSKLMPHLPATTVVPVPSSSRVSTMCARRVARKLGAELRPDLLAKKYNHQVASQLDRIINLKQAPKEDLRLLKAVRASIGNSRGSPFAMKLVHHKIRRYFEPFSITQGTASAQGHTVLLVDDLLSSGSSLAHARAIFEGVGAQVLCLCLFSSTEGFRRI